MPGWTYSIPAIKSAHSIIGVVADDITGAAELGAAGVRRGLQAEVVIDPQTEPTANLVCIDSDSRFCDPPESARRAGTAAEFLINFGVQWIYKKVDSVLRGQVIAELEAIMNQLGVDLALLAPANPALGRTIRDGHYFVGGRPIDQTEFARDPWHPRSSSRVLEMLGAPNKFSIQVCKVTEPLPERGIIVCEVARREDLQYWAAARSKQMVVAGGAEFFGALLESMGYVPGESPAQKPDTAPDHSLFVSGSTSDSCREFVRAARACGWPVFALPEELASGATFTDAMQESIAAAAIAAFRDHRHIVVAVGLPLVLEPLIARGLSHYLVRIAEQVIHNSPVANVYVEGGATAIELARRLGCKRMRVVGEQAPGVAEMEIEPFKNTRLTIKPGSYTWPHFRRLEEQIRCCRTPA